MPKRPSDPGKTDELTRLERPVGAQLRRAVNVGDEITRKGEEERSRKAVFGERNGRFEHRLPRESPIALVECQPSVDGAGNGHAPDVTTQRHVGMPVGAQPIRIGSGSGSPHREKGTGHFAGSFDHRQRIATQAAQMRSDHGHHRRCGHHGVSGRARRARAWRVRPNWPADQPRRPCPAPPHGDGTGSFWPRPPG